LEQGCYRYDAKANTLIRVTSKDLRPLAGKQAFVKDAPVNIVFVADYSRMKKAAQTTQKAIQSRMRLLSVKIFTCIARLKPLLRSFALS